MECDKNPTFFLQFWVPRVFLFPFFLMSEALVMCVWRACPWNLLSGAFWYNGEMYEQCCKCRSNIWTCCWVFSARRFSFLVICFFSQQTAVICSLRPTVHVCNFPSDRIRFVCVDTVIICRRVHADWRQEWASRPETWSLAAALWDFFYRSFWGLFFKATKQAVSERRSMKSLHLYVTIRSESSAD